MEKVYSLVVGKVAVYGIFLMMLLCADNTNFDEG